MNTVILYMLMFVSKNVVADKTFDCTKTDKVYACQKQTTDKQEAINFIKKYTDGSVSMLVCRSTRINYAVFHLDGTSDTGVETSCSNVKMKYVKESRKVAKTTYVDEVVEDLVSDMPSALNVYLPSQADSSNSYTLQLSSGVTTSSTTISSTLTVSSVTLDSFQLAADKAAKETDAELNPVLTKYISPRGIEDDYNVFTLSKNSNELFTMYLPKDPNEYYFGVNRDSIAAIIDALSTTMFSKNDSAKIRGILYGVKK